MFDSLGIDLLIGKPDLARLRIDVNHAVAHTDKALRFLNGHSHKDTKTVLVTTSPFRVAVVSKAPLRDPDIYAYLDYIEGPGKSDEIYSAHDVTFDDTLRGLPASRKFQYDLAHNYANVWQLSRDEMPRLLNPQLVAPHEERFKQNAKPLKMPPPKMSKARRRYWDRQRRIWLKAGMIRENNSSRWACIPHQVAKPMRSKTHSHIRNIRPVWNLSRTNDRFDKIVPSYPHPIEQIYRILQYRYYFKTDLTKAFSAVGLAPGPTQEATSIWLPTGTSYALYSSTRLLLGGKNSATVFQNIFRRLLQNHMSHEALEHTANFADDIIMAADTPEELYTYVREFLALAQKVYLKLNPRKTAFGRSTTFYGFTIDANNTYCYSDDKLQNFMNATPPTNADGSVNTTELRMFLGVAIQMQRHIPNLATILRPLHSATGKGRHIWTSALQRAFDATKRAMSTRHPLHKPDDKRQYHVETDASDAGIGAFLYQLEEDGSTKRPICFFSRALTVHERAKPTYYREAEALISAIEHARLYMESSPYPLVVHTDQIALTWIFKSEKTKLTSWRLARLAHIPVEVRYIRGHDNSIADALSRRPFLGQWQFATDIDVALSRLPPYITTPRIMWVYAANQTTEVSRRLRTVWHTKKVYTDAINAKTIARIRDCDVIVAMPRAHDATRVASLLLASQRSSATLVPLDLLQHIQLPPETTLEHFTIVVLSDVNYAWIIHRPGSTAHVVCPVRHIDSLAHTPDGLSLIQAYGTAADWATEYVTSDTAPYKDSGLHKTPSGLYTVTLGDKVRTIVPATRQTPLIHATHELLAHAGATQTRHEINRYYTWPTLAADVKSFVGKCICAAARARHRLAHGNYRDRTWTGPCGHWQIDFKAVAKSTNGFAIIMYAICSDSRYLRIWALPSRAAKHVHSALRTFIHRFLPKSIHSDNEGAMIGAIVRGLLSVNNVTQTFTENYHPESNGTAERVSAFLNFCLRTLTDAQYRRWDELIALWERAWNCTFKDALQCTPHEVVIGHPPPLPTAVIGRLDVDTRDYDLHAMLAQTRTTRNMFIRIAKWQTLRQRHGRTIRLNRDINPITFTQGDAIFYYKPSNSRSSLRRAKHAPQWQPGVVVARRGTLYEVRDTSTDDIVLRTVKNIVTRTPSDISPTLALRDTIIAGEGVLVAYNGHIHYAVIQSRNDSQTLVQLYGADSPDPSLATFKALYRTPHGLRFQPSSLDDTILSHAFKFSNTDSDTCHVIARHVDLLENRLPRQHVTTVNASKLPLAAR